MDEMRLVGFVPKRRGVAEHLLNERLTLNEYLVFDLLLLYADRNTGCGKVCAATVKFWTGHQMSINSARRALAGLESKDYVILEKSRGKLGNYVYRVQNYELFRRVSGGATVKIRTHWDKKTNKCEEIETPIEELFDTFGVSSASESASDNADVTTRNKEQGTRDTDSPAASSNFSGGALRLQPALPSGLKMATPTGAGVKASPAKVQTQAPVSINVSPAAKNLTDIFEEQTKHWKFRQTDSRPKCAQAFSGLLKDSTEEEIAETIGYAMEHDMYATGMRTVSKQADPWDWFIERYHEIRAHMLDDADYAKRVAARIAKKTAAIKEEVAAIKAPPADPNAWLKENRRPKNLEERALMQTNPERWKHLLFDPACPHGCKKGTLTVSDYPDDPVLSRLTHTEICDCVLRKEMPDAETEKV